MAFFFYWFKTHTLCSEAGTPRVSDLRLPRCAGCRQCCAVLAGLVLQLEAQPMGRMDLNMHVGSAVRRKCRFLLFQYLCIIKLIQTTKYLEKKKKRRKKSRAIPVVVSESDPVEVSQAGERQRPRNVWCWCHPAWRCSYLSSWLWVTVNITHNFPAFMYVGMEPRCVSPSNLL